MRILYLACLILLMSPKAHASFWPFSLFQSDNTIVIQNDGDPIVYTNNRNAEYFETLRSFYNGLSSEETLNDLLQRQEYVEVLNYLWSEEDQNVRIAWLEKKLPEHHPILICELALEYILRDPSIRTYLFSSRPLLDVALCLTEIDSDCTADESVSAASGFLNFQYGDLILETLLDHHSRESVQACWKDQFVEFKKNKFKLLRAALSRFTDRKKYSNIPSPRWVFSHGLEAFSGNVDSAAYPESEWEQIRRKEAQDCLIMILEDEKKMKKNPSRYVIDAFKDID